MRLHILSGGAAQSVVNALAGDFRAATGYELACTFSAVGAMKAKLLSGAPADLVILTQAVVAELAAGGQVLADSRADLGRVRTGVAVRTGDPLPDVAAQPHCARPCSPQRKSSVPTRRKRPRASISPACWTASAYAATSDRG